jgi:hypothetical protein
MSARQELTLPWYRRKESPLAYYALTKHFNYFFRRLNPSPSFEAKASAQYAAAKGLVEDRSGLARELAPVCFLQGSYRHETATYTINDVDIVVLCALWQPGSGGGGSSWDRDTIFDTIAAPLKNDYRYRGKVRYRGQSMCIKLEVEPRLEILPVVYKAGNHDSDKEPFRLYRPESGQWEDGYARYHRAYLSEKNRGTGNFIPAIKVFKHLRSRYSLRSVSFHIECLLYSFPDRLFVGGPADYIPALLSHLVSSSASSWYAQYLPTPCGERDIFTASEWSRVEWGRFHQAATRWAIDARAASQAADRDTAISRWQALLGSDFFPGYAA